MRRALTVVALSVLAAAVIAPAAQGRQKNLFFQDLSLNGPFSGQIFLSVIYRDKHGNGGRPGNGKFTPQWAIGYALEVQVGCNPGGMSDLSIGKNSGNPSIPFKQRLNKGRFANRFEAELDPQLRPPVGEVSGRVTRKSRVHGAFDVEDWDPNPGSRENCVSSGSFSATPCKTGDPRFSDWKMPICRFLKQELVQPADVAARAAAAARLRPQPTRNQARGATTLRTWTGRSTRWRGSSTRRPARAPSITAERPGWQPLGEFLSRRF